MKRNYAPAFMYMGVTLGKLEDEKNAMAAFDKALEIDK